MIYLLDTNIISETLKRDPDPKVTAWLGSVPNHHLSISVLALGEIRRGAEKLNDVKRKAKIIQWLEIELVDWFDDRIIPIDARIADKWGFLSASSIQTLPAIDSLIAASALSHGLTLVTRNTKDFQKVAGLELFNPWLPFLD